MQQSIDYLTAYAELLRRTDTADQLYSKVLDWQFAQSATPNPGAVAPGAHVQRTISERYLRMPRHHIGVLDRSWLQHDHLPTTAIGGFKGLVVVAAMPSWNAKINSEEMRHRGASPVANRDFCESLFGVHANHASKLGWWRRVARFAYRVMEGCEPPNDVDLLLEWAAKGMIGSVDLVPFHCQNDRLTGIVADGQRRRVADPLLGALYTTAFETLRMASRLGPKAILVASRSGAYLASELASEIKAERSGDLVVEFNDTVEIRNQRWPWFQKVHLHRYVLPSGHGGATTMYTMAGQVFSTQANLTKMHASLAAAIRRDLACKPVGQG